MELFYQMFIFLGLFGTLALATEPREQCDIYDTKIKPTLDAANLTENYPLYFSDEPDGRSGTIYITEYNSATLSVNEFLYKDEIAKRLYYGITVLVLVRLSN